MVDWVMPIAKSVREKLRVLVERRRGALLLVAWEAEVEWAQKKKKRVTKTGRGVVKRDLDSNRTARSRRLAILCFVVFCCVGELGIVGARERDEVARPVSLPFCSGARRKYC